MDHTSTKRRAAGKFLLGAAVVALPMTASISYAASEAPVAPAFPEAPSVSAAPPAYPAAPVAPVAPQAPAAPLVDDQIIVVDPDGEVSSIETRGDSVFILNSEDGDKGPRIVFRSKESLSRLFDRSDFPGRSNKNREELKRFFESSEGSKVMLRNRESVRRLFDRFELEGQRGRLSDEEIEEILEEVREGLEEANKVMEDLPEIIEKARSEADAARDEAGRQEIRVESSCSGNKGQIVTEKEGSDGVRIIRICQERVMAQALEGLREARRSIKSSDMDRGTRSTALRDIDRVISRWESEAR